jgi:rod shape-determining protein MreC
MRIRKIDRYLLLLAGLFVLAVLRRSDLPGEEVLPDLYRTTVHRPLLAQAANALAGDEQEGTRLRSELEAARREIAELKMQLSSREKLGAYFREIEWPRRPVAIPAWVFSVERDAYRRTFRIDAGTAAGISDGMPVVVGKALLGQVIEAQRRQSIVRRVDDPGFRIEVEVTVGPGEFARGIAVGDGARGLDVRFLRAAGELQAGAPVFTTAHVEQVPPGLLVGWIDEVEDTERDGVLEVSLTPAAYLGRLSQVEVLKAGRGARKK